MASTARIDELKKKFDENPRRYFAPLANEFRKAGDIDQAIMICEEFLPQQPGHMSGHIVYGQALYEAARFAESRTVFETALGLDPENLIALRHLGDIALKSGDDAGARSWYLRVLDADPRNEEMQALLASLSTASAAAEAAPAEAAAPTPPPPPATSEPVREPEPELVQFTTPTPSSMDVIQEVEIPALELDSALPDTLPAGMPAIPSEAVASAAAADADLLDGFSLSGFEKEDDHPMGTSHVTPGLETTAFVPPTEEIQTLDLDSSLGSGVPEFSAPETVTTLDGLQGSGGIAHSELHGSAAEAVPGLDALDLDLGLTTPPQGDKVSPTAPTPIVAHRAITPPSNDLLDFEMPVMATPVPAPAIVQHVPWAQQGAAVAHEPAAEAESDIPFELPPEVIAAEAEHAPVAAAPASAPEAEPAAMPELAELQPVAEPEVVEPSAPAPSAPFVTETMAELYMSQGLRNQAREVYEQLVGANPGDERLRARLAAVSVVATPVIQTGPRAREFFARLASRRPGGRSAATMPPASDDFAPDPATAEEPAEQSAIAAESPAAEAPAIVASDPAPADGSIDALFGGKAGAAREDSAAAALAQAFSGSGDESPLLVGKPAHTASHELSLDSVFRDAPARPQRASQNFSFDQFFAGGERASGPAAPRTSAELSSPEAPAERSADDIEQFNSWLQGLKPR